MPPRSRVPRRPTSRSDPQGTRSHATSSGTSGRGRRSWRWRGGLVRPAGGAEAAADRGRERCGSASPRRAEQPVQGRDLDARSGSSSGRATSGSRGHGGGRPRRRRDADVVPPAGRRRARGRAQRFTTYARPGSRDPDFTIRLLRPSGRPVGAGGRRASARRSSTPIRPDETLILTLGKPQGVEHDPEPARLQRRQGRPARQRGARSPGSTPGGDCCPAAGTATTRPRRS